MAAFFHLAVLVLGVVAGVVQSVDLPLGVKMSDVGYNDDWVTGHATWYGDPHGEGSSGGACGYTQLAGTPIGSKIAAGNAPIYNNGKGCGQCYDVMCGYPSCARKPTRIVITDLCPGGTYCSTDQPAFDLSGAAISAMANPGQDGALRNIGLYEIQYKRVPCEYPNQNIVFKVDSGSSFFWISFTIKYLGGPGDIERVEIRQRGSEDFQPAKHNWGANWMIINYTGQKFQLPIDVKIITQLNGHYVVAWGAIPADFSAGQIYESRVQLRY